MGRFDGLLKGISKAVKHPPVDEVRAGQIAKAYETMPHTPNSPETLSSYEALIKEISDQYQKLRGDGLKVSKIEPGMENPYKSSNDLIADIEKNNHISYFPTEQGFGSSGAPLEHPLLNKVKVGDEEMVANDIFRIVHDYYGHGQPKANFGSAGEEAAWGNHMKMFSPEAQRALTTETRGQNSWVNFGPNGKANKANPANTVYADQKAGLLPEWAMDQAQHTGTPVVTYGPKGTTEATKLSDFHNTKPVEGMEKLSGRIDGKLYDLGGDAEGLAKLAPELMQEELKKRGYAGTTKMVDGIPQYDSFAPVAVRPTFAATALGGLKDLGEKFGVVKTADDLAIEEAKAQEVKNLWNHGNYGEAAGLFMEPSIKAGETGDDAMKREAMDMASMGMGTMKDFGKVIRTGNQIADSIGTVKMAEPRYQPKPNAPVEGNLVRNAEEAMADTRKKIEEFRANKEKAQRDATRPDLDPAQKQEGNQMLMNAIRRWNGEKI